MRFDYPQSFAIAISFHIVILIIFVVSFGSSKAPPVLKKPDHPVEIVHAVSINQDEVTAEVQRLQKVQQQKIAREKSYQKRLKQAKLQRIKEQKELARLKADRVKAEKKQKQIEKEAAARLAKLQQSQKQAEERIKKLQAEQQNAAKKKQQSLQKEQEAKRIEQALLQEQEKLTALHSQQIQGEVDKYQALIVNAISRHWVVLQINKKLVAKLLVRLAPSGDVLHVKLLQSSGNRVLDRSAENAVYKASPLPVPQNPQAFDRFREINLIVKPEGFLG